MSSYLRVAVFLRVPYRDISSCPRHKRNTCFHAIRQRLRHQQHQQHQQGQVQECRFELGRSGLCHTETMGLLKNKAAGRGGRSFYVARRRLCSVKGVPTEVLTYVQVHGAPLLGPFATSCSEFDYCSFSFVLSVCLCQAETAEAAKPQSKTANFTHSLAIINILSAKL